MRKNLIIVVALGWACVIGVLVFNTVEATRNREDLGEIAALKIQLNQIAAEADQLAALLRKIDGGQSTDKQALEATNDALELALSERGLTTIDELRERLIGLESMYRGASDELRALQSNLRPDARNALPEIESGHESPVPRH